MLPTGNTYVPAVLASDHFTGPLMKVVVEPPAIAVVAVFRTVNKLVAVVVNKPTVKVSLLAVFKLRAEFSVTPLALLMITPPVPENVAGNSDPVVCKAVPLYCKVAEAP